METPLDRTCLSRRSVFQSVFAAMISPAMSLEPDAALVLLGREFDAVSGELSRRISGGLYVPLSLIERVGSLMKAVSEENAKTWEGLRVKASVVSWDLSGDLQPGDNVGIVERMSLAIVRDLLPLRGPPV